MPACSKPGEIARLSSVYVLESQTGSKGVAQWFNEGERFPDGVADDGFIRYRPLATLTSSTSRTK